MKLYYDFHIHSALSPCADDGNTPCDIVQMAALKGLDAIAVSDHNSVKNCAAAMEVGGKLGLLVLPAMELTTSEDVHILCLFTDILRAEEFERQVRGGMLKIPNKPHVFGRQLIMDSCDNVTGEETDYLSVASAIGSHTVAEAVRKLGGVALPAHIDRSSNGMLSILGGVPDDFGFKAVEISPHSPPGLKERFLSRGYRVAQNSDAHTLGAISERGSFIEVSARSAEMVVRFFSGLDC